jgi:hypothetical protein
VQRAGIEQLLPAAFQLAAAVERSPMAVALDVMEDLHAWDEAVLAELDSNFDPYRCGDGFVPFLARWVDLGWLLPVEGGQRPYGSVAFPTGTDRLRDLVANGALLAQLRGTVAGLQRFLEIATGENGFVVEDNLPGTPFLVRITAPAATRPHEDLLRHIVENEKPAFMTYELYFDDDPPPPPPAPPAGPNDPPATTSTTTRRHHHSRDGGGDGGPA